MRNTIRNVTIVVPVLMTSCQVSENANIGPLAAHAITIRQQIRNVIGAPAARATAFEAVVNTRSIDIGVDFSPSLIG